MTIFEITSAALSGLLAGWLMHLLMLTFSRHRDVPIDMVEAMGSYVTRATGATARRLGFLAHSIGGAGLGVVYGAIFQLLGIHDKPAAILAGIILGLFHGLIVSYALMFWISEQHPIERYRNATHFVGAIHLVGHVFFGVLMAALVLLLHTF